MKRKFHVVAISVRIVVNDFGDHDPEGKMYVLKENEDKVRRLIAKNPFTTVDLVQPLIIRANAGDDIEILFENKLHYPSSIHIQDVEYDVTTSDGAAVGFNPNTTVQPGDCITYRWHTTLEGICYFTDFGNTLSSELGTQVHGLFGALIVEPQGSTWTDPKTGKPLLSGVYADIHNPFLPSFREYAWVFHDEMEIKDLTGDTPFSPHTFQPEATHAINYRSEPMRNRHRLILEGVVSPETEGEEVHHDSWMFGDPAMPILRAYVGDPVKIRVIHGGVKETHVFHYHVHQWLFETTDLDSEIKDSQAISPQASYTVSPLYGAGSMQGAFGDIIVHCHLYPHFEEGMWGMQRIFNTLQDGTQKYPNGKPIDALIPLPGQPVPPKPTKQKPGFPNFIPGIIGKKAPRPPLGIIGGRESTPLEINQFAPNAVPGAVFVNPCDPLINPIREFHIVAIQLPIVYNNQGWHDPQGRMFVLAEDEEAVCSGRKAPEPLTIRANGGDCVRLKFTNKFPEVIGGNAFQLVNRTYEAGLHVHFVKFDPLVSDGANVGWNYDSGILPGQTIEYQWFADAELKATFFHDHLFANQHQQHGVFAGINIQPRGSKYLSSHTGEEIRSGTQATITNPFIPDFREFTLLVHDFALLFDSDGNPLNQPPFPSSHDDPGGMGINYRNEPLQFRLNEPHMDPAYVFSSWVHGDPVTPLLQTYNGDPVRIRLLQGAQEESHSFNLHGQRWRRERGDLESDLVDQQHIGLSESFTLEFAVEGSGDFDLLYHYGSIDDLWIGNWGIMRSYEKLVPHLIPLPDRKAPKPRTEPLPVPSGERPPRAIERNLPGPKGAPIRSYDIVAIQTPVIYNHFGDQDPYSIIFALKENVKDILTKKMNPEPLIIRGNVGEIVEVRLSNQLHHLKFPPDDQFYPGLPVNFKHRPSKRISLHAQLLEYDVLSSDGATVGFNPDQTIAPGEHITYHWYIDQQIGSVGLTDMADIRNHRHHGAFGLLVTEPQGSVYLDPVTRKPTSTGSQVIISSGGLSLREYCVIMHDGVRLYNQDGMLIIDPEPVITINQEVEEEETEDFEDQGSRGFNYRAERFKNRLAVNPDVSLIFSSKVHGDPSTPVFLAYAGDPVVIRMMFISDRARAHTFVLHGHQWLRSDDDLNSLSVSFQGQISVGHTDDFLLLYGAGGSLSIPGDYLYRSGNIRWDIELGLWGILRVFDQQTPELAPLNVKLPKQNKK
ncbi:copper oxidase [Paenibacillus sp. Root52]|uniref:multicopper oxidase domain-containing protein n=1 Tax=Paenibacillus sp. Root52 TaxID=1736552 RepID=UPI0006FE3758|nr:multicopper oxidase domain-containing protein [Paenibacillus sp. Root52]KQY94658.1 copper oxidase [Paenibacillus sp. Root52]